MSEVPVPGVPVPEVPVREEGLAPVVAAAIVDDLNRPTRLLAAARAYPAGLAGQYELPGGKVEPDETPRDALDREIWEELGCRLVLGPLIEPPDTKHPNSQESTGEEAGKNARELTSAPAANPSSTASAWPLLNGRVMWVWLAEVAPNSPEPRAADSHEQIRWIAMGEAENLPWLASNQGIVAAITSFCG